MEVKGWLARIMGWGQALGSLLLAFLLVWIFFICLDRPKEAFPKDGLISYQEAAKRARRANLEDPEGKAQKKAFDQLAQGVASNRRAFFRASRELAWALDQGDQRGSWPLALDPTYLVDEGASGLARYLFPRDQEALADFWQILGYDFSLVEGQEGPRILVEKMGEEEDDGGF